MSQSHSVGGKGFLLFILLCRVQWKLYNSAVLGGGCHCLKAVNCHLSMRGSEWSLEAPDSFLQKKMKEGRVVRRGGCDRFGNA